MQSNNVKARVNLRENIVSGEDDMVNLLLKVIFENYAFSHLLKASRFFHQAYKVCSKTLDSRSQPTRSKDDRKIKMCSSVRSVSDVSGCRTDALESYTEPRMAENRRERYGQEAVTNAVPITSGILIQVHDSRKNGVLSLSSKSNYCAKEILARGNPSSTQRLHYPTGDSLQSKGLAGSDCKELQVRSSNEAPKSRHSLSASHHLVGGDLFTTKAEGGENESKKRTPNVIARQSVRQIINEIDSQISITNILPKNRRIQARDVDLERPEDMNVKSKAPSPHADPKSKSISYKNDSVSVLTRPYQKKCFLKAKIDRHCDLSNALEDNGLSSDMKSDQICDSNRPISNHEKKCVSAHNKPNFPVPAESEPNLPYALMQSSKPLTASDQIQSSGGKLCTEHTEHSIWKAKTKTRHSCAFSKRADSNMLDHQDQNYRIIASGVGKDQLLSEQKPSKANLKSCDVFQLSDSRDKQKGRHNCCFRRRETASSQELQAEILVCPNSGKIMQKESTSASISQFMQRSSIPLFEKDYVSSFSSVKRNKGAFGSSSLEKPVLLAKVPTLLLSEKVIEVFEQDFEDKTTSYGRALAKTLLDKSDREKKCKYYSEDSSIKSKAFNLPVVEQCLVSTLKGEQDLNIRKKKKSDLTNACSSAFKYGLQANEKIMSTSKVCIGFYAFHCCVSVLSASYLN